MYGRVLVPLDGSALADQILQTVVYMASRLSVGVCLLRVVDLSHLKTAVPGVRMNWDTIADGARNHAIGYLSLKAQEVSQSDVEVTHLVLEGHPADVIVAEANKQQDTLVAMSTHGRSGPSRWLLGSVADKTMRSYNGPILLFRPGADGSHSEQFSTLILPLDGSELAEGAIPHAANLAKDLSLRVTLVRVIDESWEYVYPADAPASPDENISRVLEQDAENYLAQVSSRLRRDGVQEVAHLVSHGDPASVIIDLASEAHDGLVVMGTHGRSGLARTVIGSVADRVVRHSGDPVLLVRTSNR